MLVGKRNACVDELAIGELRASLLGGHLEGEDGKKGIRGVRGELDVVEVGGAVVDLAYDEVALCGNVLCAGAAGQQL